MARVQTEGFEIGDASLIAVSGGGISTSAASGTYAFLVTGSDGASSAIAIPGGALSELYWAARVNYSRVDSTPYLVQFHNGGTLLFRVFVEPSTGKWTLQDHLGAVRIASTEGHTTDVYQLIELYFKIHATTGALEMKIDGVSMGTWAGNTAVASSAIDRTTLTVPDVIGSASAFMDDLRINDVTGAADDSWPGSGRIVSLVPNSTNTAQWDGSDGNQVDNHLLVDERPHDSDTTYVVTTTANEKELYGHAGGFSLPANHSITRVWVEAVAKDNAALGGQLSTIVKSGTTESVSPAATLPSSYTRVTGNRLTTNPDTLAEWTAAEVNAALFGVKTP